MSKLLNFFSFLEFPTYLHGIILIFSAVVILVISHLFLKRTGPLYDKRLRVFAIFYKIYSLVLVVIMILWSLLILVLTGESLGEGGLAFIFYFILIFFGVLLWLILTAIYFGLVFRIKSEHE